MTDFLSILYKTPFSDLTKLYKTATKEQDKFYCVQQLSGAYKMYRSELVDSDRDLAKIVYELLDLKVGMPAPANLFKPFSMQILRYTDDVILNGYEGTLEDHPAYDDIIKAREAILQHKKENPDFYKPDDPIGQ